MSLLRKIYNSQSKTINCSCVQVFLPPSVCLIACKTLHFCLLSISVCLPFSLPAASSFLPLCLPPYPPVYFYINHRFPPSFLHVPFILARSSVILISISPFLSSSLSPCLPPSLPLILCLIAFFLLAYQPLPLVPSLPIYLRLAFCLPLRRSACLSRSPQ